MTVLQLLLIFYKLLPRCCHIIPGATSLERRITSERSWRAFQTFIIPEMLLSCQIQSAGKARIIQLIWENSISYIGYLPDKWGEHRIGSLLFTWEAASIFLNVLWVKGVVIQEAVHVVFPFWIIWKCWIGVLYLINILFYDYKNIPK